MEYGITHSPTWKNWLCVQDWPCEEDSVAAGWQPNWPCEEDSVVVVWQLNWPCEEDSATVVWQPNWSCELDSVAAVWQPNYPCEEDSVTAAWQQQDHAEHTDLVFDDIHLNTHTYTHNTATYLLRHIKFQLIC